MAKRKDRFVIGFPPLPGSAIWGKDENGKERWLYLLTMDEAIKAEAEKLNGIICRFVPVKPKKKGK
jgi:hypothetical protein